MYFYIDTRLKNEIMPNVFKKIKCKNFTLFIAKISPFALKTKK